MIFKRSNQKSKIDIILLTYNNIENTKDCVKHLYDNTSDFKLIICDNGSTDGTQNYLKDISEKNKNISLYLHCENSGIVRGRNIAYKFSVMDPHPSSFICFLDNDQFVQDKWLESYMKIAESGIDIVGAEGWKMRSNFYPDHKVTSEESFSYVGCGGMMMKGELFKKIGLLDERFNPCYFEDPDICFRAFNKGLKICWNTENKVFHKPHKLLGEKLERHEQFKISFLKFQAKWVGYPIPVLSNKL